MASEFANDNTNDVPHRFGDHSPVGVTLSAASTTAIIAPSELETSFYQAASSPATWSDSGVTVISASSTTARLRLRQDWLGTRMGVLIMFQILVGMIAIICAATPGSYHPAYRTFFLAIACVAFALTNVWFACHLSNLYNVLQQLPWTVMDLVFNLFFQFSYTVAFIVILVLAGSLENHVAAGVFGAFESILYGISAFFAFARLRAGSQPGT